MINRKDIISLAVEAGNDMEWGYDPEWVRERLNGLDPDYDWEPELFEYELEEGYRTMGPGRPPSEFELILQGLYMPQILKQLEPSPILKLLEQREGYISVDKRRFTIPLEIKPNNS